MSALSEKIIIHKKLFVAVIAVFLTIALGLTGYYGYGIYLYRQTSAYAVETLKEALNPPDPGRLASLIDFRSVSTDLAQAIARTFPFFKQGPEQEREIRDSLQKAFLNKLTGKDSTFYTPQENEARDLQQPLVILPADFNEQMARNISVRENGPDKALLTTRIVNPQFSRTVPLIFNMIREKDGWVVKNLLNAQEITGQIRTDLLKRHARLREVYEEKNSLTAKKMDELLPILACSADGGLLSDGKTFILMVHVLARNRGELQANNFSVDVSIRDKSGKEIERRYLNTAQPVGPGEDFSHRWSFELDSQEKLAQELMAGIPLNCTAVWQTLGLSNSQVWHIEETPNPDRACLLAGHDHPEGFCIMPIFRP